MRPSTLCLTLGCGMADTVSLEEALRRLEAEIHYFRQGKVSPAMRLRDMELILGAARSAQDLVSSLTPFVERNSSDEFITIKIRTADVTRARAAITRATPQRGIERTEEGKT